MRITIKLPDEISNNLNEIKKKTGVNKTDLIRISISEYIKKWNHTGAI